MDHVDSNKHFPIRSSFKSVLVLSVVMLLLLGAMQHDVRGQTADVHISVISVTPPRVQIEGKRRVATRVWSFRNAYAGMLGLGERIENLRLTDSSGAEVPVRKLSSGEYEAARDAIGWTCEIKLNPPSLAADSAYASWLVGERGLIMLGDLLPRDVEGKSLPENVTQVRLSLPSGWVSFSNDTVRSDGRYVVQDADDALFFVGRALREKRERVGRIDVSLVSEGTWAFSDQEVMDIVVRVLKEYVNRIGVGPGSRVTILLSHFPGNVGAQRWSAETRGSTVTLLSGESPSRVAGLSQLSTPLTHELFHLWVPNGIRLAGNYDWFYEGFTMYEALCVSQRLGFLTFQDYLNAIGRAFDAYSSTSEGRKMSLIEASLRRWTGPPALIYQKGMLVAFLYDLTLRRLTRGKRTLDDVYRAIFRAATNSDTKRDGNEVILGILRSQDKLEEFVRKYIETADEIDLQTMLAPFGLTVERIGARTRIAVSEQLNGQQRDLLRAFGYNTEYRRDGKRGS